MATSYQAELQRLVQAYEDHDKQALHRAVQSARAALGQPEPVKLTDEELRAIYCKVFYAKIGNFPKLWPEYNLRKAQVAAWSAVSDRLWKWAGPDTMNKTREWFQEQGMSFVNQEEDV